MDNKSVINKCLSDIFSCSLDKVVAFPDHALLSELGFDSLMLIQLVLVLEESFKIEFCDMDLINENFITKYKINEMINKYLGDYYVY